MIVIRAASSHQNSRSSASREVAADATNATEMAMEMSSIIPGRRERTSASPPSRKGRPPQRKTTVPSTVATSESPGKLGGENPSQCWIISEYTTIGRVKIRLHQNFERNIAAWSPWPP